jgi:hypothetical protein
VAWVVDCALILTPLDWSRAESWFVFQKTGTWVLNSVVGVELAPAVEKRCVALNMPSMVSPQVAIELTWAAST